MNRRIFKEQTSSQGDIPFYKIGTFGKAPDAFISRELFEEYKRKYPYPEKGDLLISASGTIGQFIEFNGEDAYFQDSNIIWLKTDKSLSNKFLKAFYSQVKWEGLEGSTIKRLYNKNIENTPICFPDLKEQEVIGNFFEKIDQTITLHQRKETAAFYSRFYVFKIAYIPNPFFLTFSWEQRKLEEVCSFYSGLTYSPDDVLEGNGTLVIRSSNISEGRFKFDNNVFVDPCKATSTKVQEGDVVVVVRNGSKKLIGKHAQIKGKPEEMVIGAFMTGIRGGKTSFINALLDTTQFSKEVEKNQGATINQITTGNFRKFTFYFPGEEEQEKIGAFFSKLDDTITLHQRNLSNL